MQKYYDLTLIAVADSKSFQKDNIRIIGLSKPKSILDRLKNARKIIQEAFGGKYTFFHFHDPELLWVGFIIKLFGKKVIFDIHENILGIVQMRNWIPNCLKRPLGLLTLFFEQIGQKVFDGTILAVKPFLKHFKNYNNTIIVRNFVIIEPNEIVKQKHNNHSIIYVGAVTYSRGILDLVEATIEIQKNKQYIKLLIIGRIPDSNFKIKLTNLKETAPIPENIQFLGHINFLKLKNYISSATIGAIPLHPNENYLFSYPTKIFDYMNWGLPYVYSDIPYWEKTFGDQCGGVSFQACNKIDLKHKIEKIIYNDELWNKLARDGKNNIHKFNWESEEKKLLQLYNHINGINR